MYLSISVVRVPCRPQGVLTSDIPHYEVDVLPDDFLHIAAYSGRGVHYFVHQTEQEKNSHRNSLIETASKYNSARKQKRYWNNYMITVTTIYITPVVHVLVRKPGISYSNLDVSEMMVQTNKH